MKAHRRNLFISNGVCYLGPIAADLDEDKGKSEMTCTCSEVQ